MTKKRFLLPFGTLLAGVVFSFLVALALFNDEKKNAALVMQKEVDRIALVFSRELRVTTDLLYMLQQQLTANTELDEVRFAYLVKRLKERLPYIVSVRWFEAQLSQAEAQQPTKPHRHATQQVSFVYRYSSAPPPDPRLNQLTLASLPFSQQDIDMSWYQGLPISLYSTQLQAALGEDKRFFVLFPLYRDVVTNQAEFYQHIDGMLLLLLDLASMFEGVLGNTLQAPLKLMLQGAADNGMKVLHVNVEGVSGALLKDMRYLSTPFFFAGKEWQVVSIPSVSYFAQSMSAFPYLIFGFGSLLFMLVAYLVYRLQLQAMSTQKQVKLTTRELREANAKLEKLSCSDSLTGLYNRPYFDGMLYAELKRAQRDNSALSLLLIEFDDIERYIKHNGQSAANNALRLVALALSATLNRPSDLLARYADNTFVILLPNTEKGSIIAERCLQEVGTLAIPFSSDNHAGYVSVSIGGVTVNEANKINVDKLTAMVKIALSKAIAQGRNRVQWLFFAEDSVQD